MTAARDIVKGRASSFTEAGPLNQSLDETPPARVGQRLEDLAEVRGELVKH